MRDSDEVTERKHRLQKTIEQGSKLENLYANEDFQFYLGWLDSIRAILKDQILKGQLEVDKEEWHAKGGYTYLTKAIEGAQIFADKAKKARNTLKKLEEDLKANE